MSQELIKEAAAATKRRYARIRRRNTILFISIAFLLGLSAGMLPYLLTPQGWHTTTPPSERPLHVMTKGWYDDGKWYSYDCGEEITVKAWRP